MAAGQVKVRGLRELNRAFKAVSAETAKELRTELKNVGEPVRAAAEQLAVTNISNIGGRWSQMRLGATAKLVYVAPKARRRRGSPRSNLGGLLMQRAMLPALAQNEQQIVAAFEQMLDRVSSREGF